MSAEIIERAHAMFPFRIKDGNDHKSWAKRIMYRHEHGDKTLFNVQVQFAKAALEIKDEVTA